MAEPAADVYLGPARARTPRGFAALVVAVAGLLMAGTVAGVTMGASATSSPEATVTAFLTSLGGGNVTAALDQVDPAETDAIRPSLTAIVDKLKTLGVLDPAADLGAVAGVSATFDHVTLATEPLRDGLDAVTITGGTATLRLDPGALPVGAVVKGLLGGTATMTRTVPLAGPHTASHPIVLVARGDRWYVSFGYTIAESLRRSGQAAFPTQPPPPAVGSDSPTALVADLAGALSRRDVAGLVGLVSPTDGAPLYEYASLLQGALDHVPAISAQASAPTRAVEGGILVPLTALSSGGKPVDLGALPVDVSGAGIVAVQATATDGRTRWFLDPFRTVFDDLASVVDGLTAQQLSQLPQLLGGTGIAARGALPAG